MKKFSDKAGPLEALLLAIEFAKLGAVPMIRNQEDGAYAYAVPHREWNVILESSAAIGTEMVKAKDPFPTVYMRKEEDVGEPEKFDCWAVVEVMGHSRYAGRVTEQAIGGCAFVRVDVPKVGDRLPFTKLLGQGSIFAITPCSEEAAKAAAAQCYELPITIYTPSVQRQLDYDDGEEER